jgi:CubicO group peptidase (beta-lactamase class C family)
LKIRHLLSHTSGIRIPGLFLDPLPPGATSKPEPPSLQSEVNRFSTVAPFEVPGQTFEYNNAGYNILGALVEGRSGQPLETFLTERIYEPLGMRETMNHIAAERTERMSVVYERNPADKDADWKIRFRQDSPLKVPFVRGSGGMISTAADFAAFCQMFLNEGTYNGKRLLAAELVRQATSPQTRSAYGAAELEKRTSFYGFGWNVHLNGVYSHGGSDGTFVWVDPQRRIVGLILTQSPGGKIPRKEFIELVNAACDD